MSLNEGFWAMWELPAHGGYKLGHVVMAEMEISVEVGREIQRSRPTKRNRDRIERRAWRRVERRVMARLGYPDFGGEG